MSIRPVDAWELVCDWPECKSKAECGDYTIFDIAYTPGEVAEDCDWLTSKDRASHYCRVHRVAWASDHESGEPFPDPPYLLIHDGDTDDDSDDGSVTLVEGGDGA